MIEHGVNKLSADYLDAARSEQHYENTPQVVEADWKLKHKKEEEHCKQECLIHVH